MRMNGLLGKAPWRLAMIFALIVAGTIAGGVFFYRQQRVKLALERQSDLDAIATLKSDEIAQWRRERYGDATILSRSRQIPLQVRKLYANPGDRAALRAITERLDAYKIYDTYQGAFLLDRNAKILLTTDGQLPEKLGSATTRLADSAAATRSVIFSEFYRCAECGEAHLDVIAPLCDDEGCAGIVILRINTSKFLYPLIQSWPVPSKSSETLIVRRDGDSVLFLNDLRFAKDAAMKLRRPLRDTLLPAAMAALGKVGMVEGKDYRGVEVLASVKHIPDSPWYMVAKIDADEVYAPVRRAAIMILLAALGLITMAGAGIALYWQRSQRDLYRDLHRAEMERKALVSHFEYVIKNANDIIILADDNQRIIEANDRAMEAYGYTRDELYGKPISMLRPRTQWADFDSQLQKLRAAGDLIYETSHCRKNGEVFPVEISARFIMIEGRQYYQAITRDITERKKAQAEIATRNKSLELLHQCSLDLASLPHGTSLPDALTEWLKKITAGYAVTFGEYDRDKREIVLKRILLEPGALARLETAIGRRLMDVRSPVSPETYRLMMAEEAGTRATLHEITFGAIPKLVSTTVGVMLGVETYVALVYQTEGVLYGTSVIALKKGQSQPDTATLKAFAALGAVSLRRAAAEDKLQSAYEELQASYQEIEANNEELVAAEEELRQKNEELTASEEELKANEEELEQQMAELQQSQEKLRVSETSYRRLFEAAKDGILILNADTGVIEDANPFIKELLGYPREELMGKELWQIGLFRDIVASRDSFVELKNQGYVRYEDLPLQTKDGRKKEVEFVSNVYPVGDHNVVQCNIRDITARKQAEQAQAVSEHKFRALFEHMAAASCLDEMVYDNGKAVDYRILDINPSFEQIIGVTRKDTVGKLASELYGGGEIPFFDSYAQVAELGKPASFEAYFPPAKKHLHITVSCPEKGRFSTVFTDITERKRIEQALAISEDKFKFVFERSTIGKSITLFDGTVNVNQAFCDMLGCSADELKNKKWQDLSYPDDIDATQRELDKILSGQQESVRFEKRYLRKDGTIVWADVSTALRRDDERKPQYFITAVVDITERKRAEDAIKTSEEELKKYVQELERTQQSLIDAQARYAQLFSGMKNCVAVYKAVDDGADFVFTDFNEAAQRAERTPKEHVLGRKVSEVFPGIKPMGLFEVLKRVWKTGVAENHPVTIYQDQRLIGWRENYVYKLPAGEIVALYEDVTEIKQAELALRANQQQLDNAMDIARLAYWEYDVIKDLFTFNDNFYKIFRTTAEKAGGYTMRSADYARRFVHPEDAPLVAEEVRKSIETTSANFSNQLEHRIIYDDGGVGYITVKHFAIKDSQNRTIRTYGVNQDITERKRAEEALHASEQRWKMLVSTSPDFIALHDSEGRFIYLNHYAEGFTETDVIGKSLYDYIAEESRDLYRQTFAACLDTQRTQQFEYAAFGAHKEKRIYESSLVPIIQGGSVVHVMAIAHDITERRENEEKIRKQLAELTRWQSSMLDREDRVLELKREINAMLVKLGQPAKYGGT